MRKINKYNNIYTTGLSHDSRNKVGDKWVVHDAKKTESKYSLTALNSRIVNIFKAEIR